MQRTFCVLPSWIVPHQAIVLGLDLQGGSHVLLEVDTQAVLRAPGQHAARRRPPGAARAAHRAARRHRRAAARRQLARAAMRRERRAADPQAPGTFARRSARAVLGAGRPGSRSRSPNSRTGSIQLSVTEAGVNERVRRRSTSPSRCCAAASTRSARRSPTSSARGRTASWCRCRALQDPRRLKDILGSPAQLEFRLVAEPGAAPGEIEMLPSTEKAAARMQVERRVIVQGEDLIDAQPAFDQRTDEPIVNFRFNIKGAQSFGQVTTETVGRPLAIVLDNKVISAPRIHVADHRRLGPDFRPLHGRVGQQPRDPAARRRAAGAAHHRRGAHGRAGPRPGFDRRPARWPPTSPRCLVVGFMIVSYGIFGVFANIALVVHVVLIFALMSLLGATLTLPGIAGIVLTIGTAVDSNVLIYERIREEFAARALDDLGAGGGLPARLRHHHRLQRHDVHRRADPVLSRLRAGEGLRRHDHHRHRHHRLHRRDADADDDRPVVSLGRSPRRLPF